MKKHILLTAALGLTGAASLTAATYDIYITGSTAFRANVFTACTNLFSGSPTIYYGNAAHGGADSGFTPKTGAWSMTGTPSSALTASNNFTASDTLNIHALFTGSVQGYAAVIGKTPVVFPNTSGSANGLCSGYVTNAPTIGFSDCSGASTPYNADGVNYLEEKVAVQPFVAVKSKGPGATMAAISNLSWFELQEGIGVGYIPASVWTGKLADTNNFVYLLQRTSDSGTRRTELAQESMPFNATVATPIWNTASGGFYFPSTNTWAATGDGTAGVIGGAGPGNNNNNLNWGTGYIAGGDIATVLNYTTANGVTNQSISYMSVGDAKGVGPSNWANVLTLDGQWPTADGAGLVSAGGTNNFAPVTTGFYPAWGYEVIVYPSPAFVKGGTSGQTVSDSQLGTGTTPGSFMGVFNAQTVNAASLTPGSIEYEIYRTETVSGLYPNTAIRLQEMNVNRPNVGGVIAPK